MNASPFTFRGISTQNPPRKPAWKGVACSSLALFPAHAGNKRNTHDQCRVDEGRALLRARRDLYFDYACIPRIKREGPSRAGRHSLEMMLRLLPPQVRQLCVQQRRFELVEEFLETLRAFREWGGGVTRTGEWGGNPATADRAWGVAPVTKNDMSISDESFGRPHFIDRSPMSAHAHQQQGIAAPTKLSNRCCKRRELR